MFRNATDSLSKSKNIVDELSDHNLMKVHARHLHRARIMHIGVNVASLEDDKSLQDAVLAIHASYMYTFLQTRSSKIIENHEGVTYAF